MVLQIKKSSPCLVPIADAVIHESVEMAEASIRGPICQGLKPLMPGREARGTMRHDSEEIRDDRGQKRRRIRRSPFADQPCSIPGGLKLLRERGLGQRKREDATIPKARLRCVAPGEERGPRWCAFISYLSIPKLYCVSL